MSNLDLKKIRKNNNLTQSGLAEKLGISTRTVQNWEAGDAIPESKKLLIQSFFMNEENSLNEESAEYHTLQKRAVAIIDDWDNLMKVKVFNMFIKTIKQDGAIQILKDLQKDQDNS